MFRFIIRSVGKNSKTYGFVIVDHDIVHTGNLLMANPKVVDRYIVNTIFGISGA